jgi:hypothetical protein
MHSSVMQTYVSNLIKIGLFILQLFHAYAQTDVRGDSSRVSSASKNWEQLEQSQLL